MENIEREVFICSSKEGLKYATALKRLLTSELKRYGLYCTLWKDDGVFSLGQATIENLYRKAQELKEHNGYAIVVITPDDQIISRNETVYIPRDNIIFELGLLTGVLGRDFVYCVSPSNIDVKIMSDWSGVTNAVYKYHKTPRSNTIDQNLRSAVSAISRSIERIERPKTVAVEFTKIVTQENIYSNPSITKTIFQEIERNII